MQKSEPSLAIITVGTEQAASTRVRAVPVIRRAREQGWAVHAIAANSRAWPIRFVLALLARPDVLVVQKVPLRQPLRWLARLSKRFVFDIDDAIYRGYPGDLSPSSYARATWETIRRADLVTVSAQAIESDISHRNRSVAVFPGPAPEIRAFDRQPARSGVLWLGSPSTLHILSDSWGDGSAADAPPITIVGAVETQVSSKVTRVKWSLEQETEALKTHAVGLAPFASGLWDSRKAAYKVFEYLAAGVIPVARHVPPIQFMLGDELRSLIEVVDVDTAPAWWAAAKRALDRPRGDDWFDARDRVLARWAADDFADMILQGGGPG